jgi:hypothetical protein
VDEGLDHLLTGGHRPGLDREADLLGEVIQVVAARCLDVDHRHRLTKLLFADAQLGDLAAKTLDALAAGVVGQGAGLEGVQVAFDGGFGAG